MVDEVIVQVPGKKKQLVNEVTTAEDAARGVRSYLNRRYEIKAQELKDDIKHYEERKDHHKRKFRTACRRIKQRRRDLMICDGSIAESIANQIVEITEVYNCDFIEMQGDRALFKHLDEFKFRYPVGDDEHEFNLGKFMIGIDLHDFGAYVTNMHDRNAYKIMTGHHGPYISSGGKICFGTVDYKVDALVSQNNLKDFYGLMVSTLNSYYSGVAPYIYPLELYVAEMCYHILGKNLQSFEMNEYEDMQEAVDNFNIEYCINKGIKTCCAILVKTGRETFRLELRYAEDSNEYLATRHPEEYKEALVPIPSSFQVDDEDEEMIEEEDFDDDDQ